MKITIDTRDIERMRKGLAQFSDRRFDSGLAEALNATARSIGDEWGGQLATRLDRPTVTTRQGSLVKRADVGRMVAEVRLKDALGAEGGKAPSEYLAPQEFGGDRTLKKFERALQARGSMPRGSKVVPGKYAKLDGFGNISRGQIVQVLNQLGSELSVGYRRVIGASVTKRAKSSARAGREYVAINKKVGRLSPGVYQRLHGDLLPVFFFVARTMYGRRLELREHGRRIAERELGTNVMRAMQKRMQTLLARGQGQPS